MKKKIITSVFISYAKEDEKTALRVYNDLKKRNIDAWIDIKKIQPGENWKSKIKQSIHDSPYFLALISSNSTSKAGFVQKELKIAIELLDERPESDIFIIPVRIDNCKVIDERIRNLHWVDIFPNYTDGFTKILKVLNAKASNEYANIFVKNVKLIKYIIILLILIILIYIYFPFKTSKLFIEKKENKLNYNQSQSEIGSVLKSIRYLSNKVEGLNNDVRKLQQIYLTSTKDKDVSIKKKPTRYDEIINKITVKLNCNKDEAQKFIYYVNNFIMNFQEKICLIASAEASKHKKKITIDSIIDKFFMSDNSKSYLHSENNSTVHWQIIQDYLTKLSNNYSGKYSKMELYFFPNYISMGSIESFQTKEYGQTFEFVASIWMIVKGYNNLKIVNESAILLGLNFIFFKNIHDKYWLLKIKSIIEKELLPFKIFYEKYDN